MLLYFVDTHYYYYYLHYYYYCYFSVIGISCSLLSKPFLEPYPPVLHPLSHQSLSHRSETTWTKYCRGRGLKIGMVKTSSCGSPKRTWEEGAHISTAQLHYNTVHQSVGTYIIARVSPICINELAWKGYCISTGVNISHCECKHWCCELCCTQDCLITSLLCL